MDSIDTRDKINCVKTLQNGFIYAGFLYKLMKHLTNYNKQPLHQSKRCYVKELLHIPKPTILISPRQFIKTLQIFPSSESRMIYHTCFSLEGAVVQSGWTVVESELESR